MHIYLIFGGIQMFLVCIFFLKVRLEWVYSMITKRILELEVCSIVISKIINHDFLMKIFSKSTFFLENLPPNVAILHLLVFCGLILIYFSGQKLYLKQIIFFFIIKSMFSLYNLKTSLLLKENGWKTIFFDKPALNTHTQQGLK